MLAELLVDVGSSVQAGDLLAQLDATEAQRAVANAELKLAQAEATLATQADATAAQRAVDLAEIQVSQAEINLASAQLKLDELLDLTPDGGAVAIAQANLDAAQESYEAATRQSAYDQTTSARISLEQAEGTLEDAQAAYNSAWDPARDWELYDPRRGTQLENERDAAISNLEKAQQNLEVAQANYNLAWANINDTGELNAWTQVVNARATLEDAQTGPTADEIEPNV